MCERERGRRAYRLSEGSCSECVGLSEDFREGDLRQEREKERETEREKRESVCVCVQAGDLRKGLRVCESGLSYQAVKSCISCVSPLTVGLLFLTLSHTQRCCPSSTRGSPVCCSCPSPCHKMAQVSFIYDKATTETCIMKVLSLIPTNLEQESYSSVYALLLLAFLFICALSSHKNTGYHTLFGSLSLPLTLSAHTGTLALSHTHLLSFRLRTRELLLCVPSSSSSFFFSSLLSLSLCLRLLS